MKRNEASIVLPDYFYDKVAKELGLSTVIVQRVYAAYQKKLVEALKTEAHIYVRGLGTLTMKPLTALGKMHEKLEKAKAIAERKGTTYDMAIHGCFQTISHHWLKLNQLKSKYEFIEGSLEKFRSNLGGFEKFFDHDGYYKGNSPTEDENLQELSFKEGE